MALNSELKKLLQQTLKIRNSQVPLHRVMDILATDDGDVSTVVYRFRDVKNDDLRRAFHNCAVLLRELEAQEGLKPSWETYDSKTAAAAPGSASSAPAREKAASAEPAKIPKAKFRPEDLQTFEDDGARGQVRVAKMYVDGASKGNPGDAGIGIALFSMEGKKIAQIARSIGTATNNIAEYTALIEGLQLAHRMGVKQLHVLGDSQLMVHQMNGVYKIKNVDILKKVQEAKQLAKKLEKFTISYIARENNTLADALSTITLKKKKAEPVAGEDESSDFMPPLDDTADEGMTD